MVILDQTGNGRTDAVEEGARVRSRPPGKSEK